MSLARQAGSDLIELMVSDQLSTKLTDLAVTLSRDKLRIEVPSKAAAALDGNGYYDVALLNAKEVAPQLSSALEAIFLGKQGLTVITI